MTTRLFVFLSLLWLLIQPSFLDAQTEIGPTVGSTLKDFTLNDQHGARRRLSGLLAKGPTALVVVTSAGWSAKCKESLSQLQQNADRFDAVGLELACLSYDSVEVLSRFSARQEIDFPLLADPGSEIIRQLKLVNTTYKRGTLRHGLAHPAIVLIDREGKVLDVSMGLPDSDKLLKLWESRQPDVGDDPSHHQVDFISIDGNKFVDRQGTRVTLKGLAIADPYKIVADKRWNREHFEAIKKWGANVIRIPVHPANFRKLGQVKYLQLLDDAVRWCEELKIYVIIDWHSIGNLKTEIFESDDKRTNMKETLLFWDLVSKRYANNSTVAFYELFNEPALSNGDYGDCTWRQWKLMIEKIVDTIQANDKQTIALVAGFNWAYDLRDAAVNPIARKGIAYVAHPYPGKSEHPREAHWEEHFGFFASRYPVFVTEMGFYQSGEYEHYVDDGSFRNGILKYLDKKQISWCAWIFDRDWSPALIEGYNYEPTESGKFFKKAMSGAPKTDR